MTYDLVLFDVDDTLLDFGKARDHALALVLTRFAAGADHGGMVTRFHAINSHLWKELEAGRVTKDQVLEGRFTRLFAEFGVKAAATDANEQFLDGLAAEPFLIDGAPELIETLFGRMPLGIISNGHGPTQRKRMARAGMGERFAFALISDEVGHAKPHPRIFQKALELAGLPASARVLMIGDNFDADIRGAHAVGFDTCWFSSKPAPATDLRPTFVARTLGEVGRILSGG
jgi:YjjG family noncanonical pyrimidine nucleotidase